MKSQLCGEELFAGGPTDCPENGKLGRLLFAHSSRAAKQAENMPYPKLPKLATPTAPISSRGPYGWPMVRLGDHTTKIGSGSTPKGGEAVYVPSGVSLVRSMNVHFDGLRTEGLAFINQQAAEKLKNAIVQEGDALLNITGASIGRITTAPPSIAGARVNQHVCIIRPTPELLPKFLSYFFASAQEQERITQVQVGATRQALTKRMIENWMVPMPSLDIQRAMIAEADKQLTRLEAGRNALRRVQANVARHRAAVLKAACEGLLVANEVQIAHAEGRSVEAGEVLLARILTARRQLWQGRGKYKEPAGLFESGDKLGDTPPGWTWATVEQIGFVQLGRQRSPKNVSKNYPTKYIRAANIKSTGLDLTDVLEMEFSPAERERYALREGDIVLAEASGSASQVGKPAFWRGEIPLCCFQNTVIRFRPCCLESRFPLVVFKHFYINGIFARIAGGVGINHLSADKFSAIRFPLPPLAEQTRIAAEVERRLSVLEELATVVTTNLQRVNSLQKTILARSFNQNTTHNFLPATSRLPKKLIPSRQERDGRSPIMNHADNATVESLLATVEANGGNVSPQTLCLACGFGEEVGAFFELLRECRNRGMLAISSGKNSMITFRKR